MAPSTTSTLHPIVIPPLAIPPHFTTLGTGLLFSSHAREPANTLCALLYAPDTARPKTWWRAQCILYGHAAAQGRTVLELRETLQMAVVAGGLVVPAELAELERRENGRFRKANAQAREAAAAVVGGGAAVAGKGKGGKEKERKDPLKGVKGAKVAKAGSSSVQAAVRGGATTSINFTFNMVAPATPVAKPKPQKQATPKQQQKKQTVAKPPPVLKAATPKPKPKPAPKTTALKAAAPKQPRPTKVKSEVKKKVKTEVKRELPW